MSSLSEHAHQVFWEAVLSDDNLGYPDRTAFVSTDIENWRESAAEHLADGFATAVFAEHAVEILLEPRVRRAPLSWLDRKRGRSHVRIRFRHNRVTTGEVEAVVTPHLFDSFEPSQLVPA